MAKRLAWKGLGAGGATNVSEVFRPKANFMMSLSGTPSANTTYTIQMSPDD